MSLYCVGFEVLSAVVMKCYVFWDVRRYSPACCLLRADFLLGLSFKPEDRGGKFLTKIGGFSTEFTALHPRSQES
jgi:hypothetical protein